jgi:hypothetical protein
VWEIVDCDGHVGGPFDTSREASEDATRRGPAGQQWKVRAVQKELAEELEDRAALTLYMATLV